MPRLNAKARETLRVEKKATERLQKHQPKPLPTKGRPKGRRPFAEQVFALHLQQLQRLVAERGQRGLRTLYEEAVADLRKQLASAPADPTRATPTILRTLIAQAEATMTTFGRKLGHHLEDVGRSAAEMGAQHAVDEYQRIAQHFTGTTPVLQLEQAAIFRGLVKGVHDQSLLRRYRNVSQTWTLNAIASMERRLTIGAMTSKGLHDMVNDVAGAAGLLEEERWKAERIVRTELAYAHQATKFEAMRRTAAEVGEQHLWKKLIATFDDRTGDDSFLVHGQAVPLERPFEWKHRVRGAWVVSPYMHPPNRPNDRETVVPWDPSWDAAAGFEAPLTRSELLSARPTRWRETIGVKVPPGHRPGKPYSYTPRAPARGR